MPIYIFKVDSMKRPREAITVTKCANYTFQSESDCSPTRVSPTYLDDTDNDCDGQVDEDHCFGKIFCILSIQHKQSRCCHWN